jgi:two-component system response regulator FixJ
MIESDRIILESANPYPFAADDVQLMDSPLPPLATRPVVAVVDDEPQVRRFLATALAPLNAEVAEFGSVAEFVAGLSERRFDCAVIDLRLPDGTGLEAAAQVRARSLTTSIVLVSGYANVRVAVQAVRDGVIEVLEKPFDPAELLSAVHWGVILCEQRAAQSLKTQQLQERVASLTESEREVLDLVLRGLPNKTIARTLHLGLRTIESRKHRLYQKLGAGSISELVQIAIAAGIVPCEPAAVS